MRRGGREGKTGEVVGEELPRPGNVVFQPVFLFPGEDGLPDPALIVEQTLNDGGSREDGPGQDRGHKLMGLGEGQRGFF